MDKLVAYLRDRPPAMVRMVLEGSRLALTGVDILTNAIMRALDINQLRDQRRRRTSQGAYAIRGWLSAKCVMVVPACDKVRSTRQQRHHFTHTHTTTFIRTAFHTTRQCITACSLCCSTFAASKLYRKYSITARLATSSSERDGTVVRKSLRSS